MNRKGIIILGVIAAVAGLRFLSGCQKPFITRELTNIPNAALVNSSITINGTVVSLGGNTEIATGGGKSGIFMLMGV